MKGKPVPESNLPYRWRSRLPDTRSAGTMYQFVRDLLRRNGEKCARSELLKAMETDPGVRKRLARSQGFRSLLSNMRHSGEIIIEGDVVIATPRALRRASTPSGAGHQE